MIRKVITLAVTSNQIPSTDEIMPDLFCSGIYNTQNSQQTFCVRIYISLFECQITNKVNKERDKCKHPSREKTLKQIDVYGSLSEGKLHQSLAKPDKINFLKEAKQTELAKQNYGQVSTRCTQTYV